MTIPNFKNPTNYSTYDYGLKAARLNTNILFLAGNAAPTLYKDLNTRWSGNNASTDKYFQFAD